jgi:citronellol/citronellal dehydrogenase
MWDGATKVFDSGLFSQRVVLITGGGTGLGRAMAEVFGRYGALVAIAGRRQEVLNEACDALSGLGVQVMAQALDIRDHEAVEKAVAQVAERWGRIDVLVNNAGGQFPQAAVDITARGLDAVIRTNLYGTINMSQSVARIMMKTGGGAIVNIVVSSLERGIPGVAHTVAARAGVVGYMRTVAREWGPYNIRVNAVGPGMIDTLGFRQEMVQTGNSRLVQETQKGIPLGRLGRPSDIAALVAFLASPAASYITGQYITVDGGNSLAGGISVLPDAQG